MAMRTDEQLQLSEYLEKLVSGPDFLLACEKQSRLEAERLGLGRISLSRGEAHILRWFAQLKPAKKAVEIGTLTGASGLYILDGLQSGGKLWTFELKPEHAQAAEPILKKFADSCGKNVEVVVGDARATLEQIQTQGPFDFIFIDGNKAAYGDYLAWAEKNLRSGGVLVADNVLLGGSVFTRTEGESAKGRFSEKQIQVMQKFNQRLMDSTVWRSALLPTSEGLYVAEKN